MLFRYAPRLDLKWIAKEIGIGIGIGIAQALLMPSPLFIGSSRLPTPWHPLSSPAAALFALDSGEPINPVPRYSSLFHSHSPLPLSPCLCNSLRVQLRQLRYFLCKLHIVDIYLIQFKSILDCPRGQGRHLRRNDLSLIEHKEVFFQIES